MVKISSDNPKTQQSMKTLCDYLERNGGYISDDIEIYDIDSSTSIRAHADNVSGYIFKLPHDLLVPYDNFDFDIDGQDIVIAHSDPSVSEHHLEVLKRMVELYNVSGKFKEHLKTHPLLKYDSNPELVRSLLNARQGPDIKIISEIIGKPDFYDELALLTFFKSRLLHCNINDMQAKPTAVMIPVVEFMNHNPAGAGFDNLYSKQGGHLAIKASMPVAPDNLECFTNYGRFDALDSYLHYGFGEESAKYVRSVPLKIDLGDGGTLSIKAFNTSVPQEIIPPHLSDMSFYFPMVHFDHTHKIAELGHVLIPQENARFSMRRLLEYVINILNPDINEEKARACISRSENQIVRSNLEYYEKIEQKHAEKCKNSTKENAILTICDGQIKKIKTYKSIVNQQM